MTEDSKPNQPDQDKALKLNEIIYSAIFEDCQDEALARQLTEKVLGLVNDNMDKLPGVATLMFGIMQYYTVVTGMEPILKAIVEGKTLDPKMFVGILEGVQTLKKNLLEKIPEPEKLLEELRAEMEARGESTSWLDDIENSLNK